MTRDELSSYFEKNKFEKIDGIDSWFVVHGNIKIEYIINPSGFLVGTMKAMKEKCKYIEKEIGRGKLKKIKLRDDNTFDDSFKMNGSREVSVYTDFDCKEKLSKEKTDGKEEIKS